MLHLSDQRIWNGLENLFIKREHGMNLQDVLMCATTFGKKSSNDQVWRRIEDRTLAERDRITEVKDVVLLFYAFANAKRKMPELWEALEKMTLASMPRYKQKELALAAWSFSKMNYGSEDFWAQLEKAVYPYISSFSIQNLAITSYAFAKMNRKTQKVWNLLQSAVLTSFKETSGQQPKPQDVANLVWSFANLELGDSVFWGQMESISVKNIQRFNMLDLTNIAWSFKKTGREYPKFWPELFNYLRNQKSFDIKHHQDIVLMSEVLTEINCKDIKVWHAMIKTFETFLRSGVYRDYMFRARWHKCFFELKPDMWDKAVEDIYLGSIQASEKDPDLTIQALYNVCLCAFPNFGSKDFWRSLSTTFQDILAHPDLIEKYETINRTSNLMYLLNAKHVSYHEDNENPLEGLDEAFDTFYRDESNFLKMINSKFNLMVQLKSVVLQRYKTHYRIFWNQLKIHKNSVGFSQNDIKPLIFAIIVKNGLYFEPDNYQEIENRINNYLPILTPEQIDDFVAYLVETLFILYKDHRDIVHELQTNPKISSLDLVSLIRKHEDFDSKEAEIQREYKSIMDRYQNNEPTQITH